jgi:peptidoglycan/LPS O-acetylase OafA/YrhL
VELRPAGFLSRVLSLAPLVWIGRDLSYGLYLWHYPLGRLMADLELGAWQAPATVLAAFGAATASHYLVERPLARRKHGHPLAEPAR